MFLILFLALRHKLWSPFPVSAEPHHPRKRGPGAGAEVGWEVHHHKEEARGWQAGGGEYPASGPQDPHSTLANPPDWLGQKVHLQYLFIWRLGWSLGYSSQHGFPCFPSGVTSCLVQHPHQSVLCAPADSTHLPWRFSSSLRQRPVSSWSLHHPLGMDV